MALSRRSRHLLLTTGLLIACFARSACAAPKETWLAIFMGTNKIGYTSVLTENTTYRGKPAIKDTSTSITRLVMFGNIVSQDITSVTYSDTRRNPITQKYTMKSNGSVTTLVAEYEAQRVRCVVSSGSESHTKDLPIPAGAKLVSDSSELGTNKLAVGQKATLYFLNPMSVALDRSDISVDARERVRVDGVEQDLFRATTSTTIGKATSWETADGEPVRTEMPLGLIVVQEPRDRAMDMKGALPAFVRIGQAEQKTATGYEPPVDFAISTAISVDGNIPDSGRARHLVLEIQGISDKQFAISDERQHLSPVPGSPGVYRATIDVEPFDASASASLPISSPQWKPYMASGPYLETDASVISEQAQKLHGTETNAFRVANRIRDWVHSVMTPDYTIGVPRSCVDVMKRRRGVCRDYATLFASLARSAGIPTRLVGGIVYDRNRFFYHAWAECWVGQWVAFDPTRPAEYVDATHVKFAHGDVTDMYGIVGVVGRLKIRVVEAK